MNNPNNPRRTRSGKLANRTKLGWQLYNTRRMLRNQAETIALIKDDLTLVALEEIMKFEQTLFRIETGMWNKKLQITDEPEEQNKGEAGPNSPGIE